MSVTVFPAPSSGGAAAKSLSTVFINSTQSWTAPAGVTVVDLMLVGGGGAGGGVVGGPGGSCGGGGGGGGVVTHSVAVNPGTSYTVTIGAGGARSTGTGNGGLGGNTTFGSLLTALGGGGGQGSAGAGGLVPGGACGGGAYQGNPSSYAGGGGGFYPNIGQPTPGTTRSVGLQGNNGNPATGPNASAQGGGAFLGLFGAGGGGGSDSNVDGWNLGGYNAGRGSLRFAGIQATAGVANFGGGGGGGDTGAYPQNGGSGTCIIRYWS